jgi:hypothetical protein
MPVDAEEFSEELLARVRLLRSDTVVHIPVSQRPRHAIVIADLLTGISLGNVFSCRLEEARSRLLLAIPPRKFNLRVELAKRMALWEAGSFESLVSRIEDQARSRSAPAQTAPEHASLSRHARRLVAEGT